MVGKKKGKKNIETLGDSRGCILLACHKHGLCQRSWETLNVTPYLGITCMHAVLCKYIYICTLSFKNIRIFIFDIILNENYV